MILYDIIWYYMILYDYHMYDMYVKCVCWFIYIYQLMPCVYLSSQFAVGDTTVFYCGGY